MEISILIMAGGRGERFWPMSRVNLPKQFLSLNNDGVTMIQHTFNRIKSLVKLSNIYVATNACYKSLVMENLPDLYEENILCEPTSRNTAPCIGIAAMHIQKKNKDSIMIVLASDHLITHIDNFIDALNAACRIAETANHLVTIGIPPYFPATGYGYIKFDQKIEHNGLHSGYRVEQFIEKPCIEKAREYVKDGRYFWNSGIFIWSVTSILQNIKNFLPDIYAGLERIQCAIGSEEYDSILEKEYNQIPSISIDYGVMEKSKDIIVLPGSFGWDDVGSWMALERISKVDKDGNIIVGNAVTIDVENSIIQCNNKLVAILGMKDLIVVDTDDVLLICEKSQAGNVKKMVKYLTDTNRLEYL